ncbi:F0F1 ATP synthase subunit delta [Garicola koreensis]|uniref:ATP synthase subunit delta n=1 Tax=Garicola koreensis TaxID=1262554 RepID=A0A7W5TSU0_9MICC|nr:F0F1 ATP synthase subunit delta [Garicola koreensis]MBB3666793.1 F-type H+-transporting ATPase subunit delta [Garicola koreensis]
MATVTSESQAALASELAETISASELTVADELFSALDVMDHSAALRRALTDPSREPQERAAVVRSLFGAQAQQKTVTMLEAVVSRRWGADRDLGEAIENLAVTVVAAQAERTGLQGLEELEGALLGFRHTVAGSHEVQHALTDHQAPASAKQKLAARLSPAASAEARLLIDRAVTAPRGMRPTALVGEFASTVAARQQRWIAQVTVAKDLGGAYLEKLSSSLDRYFGRELRLDVVVDPTVVGGIRAQVGDEVVDSTVAARLNSLQRKISR